ncbi:MULTISPECIES: CaiB/BaiF CoA-transferase family protein [unclassified Streptomyces]|uniref:CaiB/BaiF CoA transferase family protein n=1 Tax=unclassified Streptomyces TaxID=2593676 RepID=UPI002E822062|nr:CaiB/BaiF CoA-transferase family protein [Streptomyces sp. NBC_00589]WTI41358.1 CoA transferase [Streptomyces sp. NBC_00775]WUB24958.1 CoA transferase [Streptomyces sp. NBC_00589]
MSSIDRSAGPLAGLRVLELAGLGPAPHAAMVLADLGADVVRVERPSGRALQLGPVGATDIVRRGRRSVFADLKEPEGRALVLALSARADVFVEGLRPGVAERLGVGPDDCGRRNPGLVYARVTGWGQDGPLAQQPGHDLNYIGLTGVLHAMGREDGSPPPPLNLVGDFGGGSMLLAVGVLAALWERSRSGAGQVVDAAMIDGTALLSQMTLALRAMGEWSDERSSNLLDGAAPFYDTYTCGDGKYVAVAALEPHFFAALLDGLGIDPARLPAQGDRGGWPVLRSAFAKRFASRTRDEWATHFAGTDACVTPVLTFAEAGTHPHVVARRTLVEVDGILQAAPAPRFSRTPSRQPSTPDTPGGDTESVLRDWGVGSTADTADTADTAEVTEVTEGA